MKDITPKRYRCGIGSCPGVFMLDDGGYAVRGELIRVDDNTRPRQEAIIRIDPQMIIAALKEQLWSED